MIQPPDLYWYRARVARPWKDADSVYLDIDQGRKIWQLDQKHRLARIDGFGGNSPKKAEGVEFCNVMLPVGKLIYVRTVPNTAGVEKQEKWGRWLAELYIQVDDIGPLLSFQDILVKQGLALYWDGQGPHPTGEVVR